MNPFDEIALEGALRLRETRGGVEEIVALSAGGVECAQQLRTALAMGADRAVLVRCESELDSYLTAEIIAAVYKQARYDMVIAGKQAVDTDANQTGQILAAILGVPLAPFASAVSVDERWSSAEVTCEVDSGWETLRIALPAVITVDLRLNEPRYPSLPGMISAKMKPLQEVPLNALGIEYGVRVRTRSMQLAGKQRKRIKVETVKSLAHVIREVLARQEH